VIPCLLLDDISMSTSDAFRDAEHIADIITLPATNSGDEEDGASRDRADSAAISGLRDKAYAKAKVVSIDRLLRDLDILIYCELSALYYMDCSLILFATRAIVQLIFFTPKAPPFDPTRNQPFIGAIFSSNLFCMLLHLMFVHPEAGEDTRGYLHGGLFIDFIGQKSPVPIFRLLFFDFLVLIVHLIMLGLIVERVKSNVTGSNSSTAPTVQQRAVPNQDADSEERGVLRNENPPSRLHRRARGDDIELAVLENRDETDVDTTELLTDFHDATYEQTWKDSHPLDPFCSGEVVILDMSILETIRDQWHFHQAHAPARSASFVPSTETSAFLRERFGIQVGPDGRVVRVARQTP